MKTWVHIYLNGVGAKKVNYVGDVLRKETFPKGELIKIEDGVFITTAVMFSLDDVETVERNLKEAIIKIKEFFANREK